MFEMPNSSVPEALLQKPTIIETVLSFLRRGPYRRSNPLSSSPVIPLYEVNLWLSFDTRAKISSVSSTPSILRDIQYLTERIYGIPPPL